ncbi:hypothetical protein ymoll0001_18700 [Yersinia mollaretii ATCC 43969]|uniref:Uncharacterized protein n=1 Tax=Yersinia mollaretii (strain ATCC 43969 / DSM 18520 / CIP 103324 / CNY 7263 / WAIP 204) TaxID=349967 RepID=A0ABM9Y9S8_YERMW|nr:hypothetical protein ymoll0001_18700 [Yersinia mollaretii ATCC 43969]
MNFYVKKSTVNNKTPSLISSKQQLFANKIRKFEDANQIGYCRN